MKKFFVAFVAIASLFSVENGDQGKKEQQVDDFPSYWDAWQWLARVGGSYQWRMPGVNVTSIDTIQPLYITDQTFRHTAFFQFDALLQGSKHTVSGGLGYRVLTPCEWWLVGVNSFFDARVDHAVHRFSVGADIQTPWATLSGNYYRHTTTWIPVAFEDGITTEQRAVDGGDVNLSVPLPYMPWFRVQGSYFRWNFFDEAARNGYRVIGNIDVAGPLSVSGGTIRDDVKVNNFVQVALRLGNPIRIMYSIFKNKGFTKEAFPKRNMRRYLLEPVNREKMVVYDKEQTGSNGINIGRGT